MLFTGEMDDQDLDFDGRAARVGLSCVACHTIEIGEGTRGNGDYLFKPRRMALSMLSLPLSSSESQL